MDPNNPQLNQQNMPGPDMDQVQNPGPQASQPAGQPQPGITQPSQNIQQGNYVDPAYTNQPQQAGSIPPVANQPVQTNTQQPVYDPRYQQPVSYQTDTVEQPVHVPAAPSPQYPANQNLEAQMPVGIDQQNYSAAGGDQQPPQVVGPHQQVQDSIMPAPPQVGYEHDLQANLVQQPQDQIQVSPDGYMPTANQQQLPSTPVQGGLDDSDASHNGNNKPGPGNSILGQVSSFDPKRLLMAGALFIVGLIGIVIIASTSLGLFKSSVPLADYSDKNISMVYPEGMEAKKTESGVTFSQPGNDNPSKIEVDILPTLGQGEKYLDILEKQIEQADETDGNTKISSKDRVEVSGQPAIKYAVELTQADSDKPAKGVGYLIYNKSKDSVVSLALQNEPEGIDVVSVSGDIADSVKLN